MPRKKRTGGSSKSSGELGAKGRKVMREFSAGTLRSSSGKKVTSRDQALAIAFDSDRRVKRKRRR